MNILIISMTCGEGHNSMARAIRNELEKREHTVSIVDIYENNKFDKFFNDYGFRLSQKFFPKLFDKIWFKQRERDPEKRYSGGIQGSIKKPKKFILQKINEFKPDAIICTHYYASALISNLIRENLISDIKTYSILTDYCLHPYWESSHLVDSVFIPHNSVESDMIKKGFKKSQLVESGIPINEKFFNKIDKKEARKELNMPDKFSILILLGGFGFSNPKTVLKSLSNIKDDITVSVVCGRNKKLYKSLSKFVKKNGLEDSFKIYGFISNMDILIDASDVAISRAGATTITECLYKNLPLLFREKLYINEKLNEELFIENNLALKLSKDKLADIEVLNLIKNPKILEDIRTSQQKFEKLNSIKIIADTIENDIKKHD